MHRDRTFHQVLIGVLLVILVVTLILAVTGDDAHGRHDVKGCDHACVERVKAEKRAEIRKRNRDRKLRYIAPYRTSFLGPVGACESGTTTNLRHGLRAVSSTGQYRGRYQFGMPDWAAAGGHGDPIDADWLEQAYRAVRWLKINGRDSWPNC